MEPAGDMAGRGGRPPVAPLLAVALSLAVLAAVALVLVDGGAEESASSARLGSTTSSTSASTTVPTTTTPSTTAPAATSPTTAVVAVAPPAPAAASCPAVPARAEPRADRTRYRMDVTVDLAAGRVLGGTEAVFTPDLPTDRLVFRLWPNGPRSAARGAALGMMPPALDGEALRTEQPDPTTLVAFPPAGRDSFAAGEPLQLFWRWTLTLPGATTNDRVAREGDAVRLGTYAPLLAWEPGVGWATDPPTAGFAEASVAAPADWDVAVAVVGPDGGPGAASGLSVLAGGVQGADGRWRLAAAGELALSVGRFRVASGTARAGVGGAPVAVTVGVHDPVADAPEPYVEKLVRVLEDFAGRYGPYAWPSYSLAVTPELTGGIEYPAHVMQGPGRIGRTTSHEVAHMWFFALVANNQGRHPVLDEGLATWAEARFEGTVGEMRSRSIPSAGRGRAGAPMTYWEPRLETYYRSVYVQGAQALAALGDPGLVDCALHHYVARTAHRIARPEDLVAAASLVFPNGGAVLSGYGIPYAGG